MEWKDLFLNWNLQDASNRALLGTKEKSQSDRARDLSCEKYLSE